MMRFIAIAALLALSACVAPQDYTAAPEPIAEATAKSPATADCAPGEGDGIGGTGCKID